MKKTNQVIVASVAAIFLVAGSALSVFAETSSSRASTAANLKAGIITRAKDRADQEIGRRITALNGLTAQINGMVRVSGDEKNNLLGTLGTQITAMNALLAQIDTDASDNSTSSLKDDVQSITKSYRIFMLVIPQGALTAAADRVMTIASTTGTLAGKLQTRITMAQASGTDMSASVSALADLNVKLADASAQAQATLSEISGLKPDNGDQAVTKSNTAALKDARAKIKTAQQDLVAARKDAGMIVKALTAKS